MFHIQSSWNQTSLSNSTHRTKIHSFMQRAATGNRAAFFFALVIVVTAEYEHIEQGVMHGKD
jgi:inosine/xanthosine triphosphate pyrophosphatase family protein